MGALRKMNNIFACVCMYCGHKYMLFSLGLCVDWILRSGGRYEIRNSFGVFIQTMELSVLKPGACKMMISGGYDDAGSTRFSSTAYLDGLAFHMYTELLKQCNGFKDFKQSNNFKADI